MDIPNPKDSRGMLRVSGVGDKVIGIQFRHIKTKTFVGQQEKSLRITHCGLFELEADEKAAPIKISYGVAKCAEADNFSRERGRKLALARALASGDHQFASDVEILDGTGVVLRKAASGEVKRLREIVWKTYFDRIPKGKVEDPTPVVQETVDGIVVKPVEEPVVLH